MDKILLIIQREYLSRVRKKAFIVMTLLVPVLFSVMIGVIILITKNSDEINKTATIKVIDQSGDFKGLLHSKPALKFVYANQSLADAKKDLKKDEDLFVLFIPKNYTDKNAVEIISQKKSNFVVLENIEGQMEKIATGHNMVNAGIDTAKLKKASASIDINVKQLTQGGGEKDASIGAAYGLGIAGAILIYLSLFIYGAQVMRGVIEEKTSRIIEVIVSSVKPFQLMIGKIVGVGAVGLTQFALWILLSWTGTVVTGALIAKDQPLPVKTEKISKYSQAIKSSAPAPGTSPAANFMKNLSHENYVYILGCFIFYFLSGYLLYSALFAAVGSAVDSETETQQFMFPITLPLLFTYFLSFAFLVNNPDSSLAFWLSMIPLTAPVAMMVRVPFDVVPAWQLALSMSLMVAGFIFTTWVAARIYRVGVLMYGKKASYKELAKWFFYKE